MKRNIVLSLMALCVCAFSYGQGEIDAYRLSRNDLSGTARGMAMGGSMGALGGDVTGIAANPAGIAIYHSWEVLTSMNLSSTDRETSWKGSMFKENNSKFNFNTVSLVLSSMSYPLADMNFHFSYNRLKNFDRHYTSGGRNMGYSLTDYIARITNGTETQDMYYDGSPYGYYNPYDKGKAPWLGILGWNGYLIDSEFAGPSNTSYLSALEEGELVNPNLNVSEKGYIESYDFSFGMNITEKLLFGFTASIMDLSYSMQSFYAEEMQSGGRYNLKNDLSTGGSGFKFSTGIIFRPGDALRFGIAYHSPTGYSLNDRHQGVLDANFNSIQVNQLETSASGYSYMFKTPYRWTLSAATVLGTKAAINLDYELADYRSMDLEDDEENNYFIDQDFKVASTLRAGIEYRVTPLFALRAGYAWMQNPYEKNFKDGNVQVMTVGTIPHYTLEGNANYMTCGFGYVFPFRTLRGGYYIDVAFVYGTQTDNLYYYPKFIEASTNKVLVDSTPAKFKNNMFKGVLTIGWKAGIFH